MARPRTNLLWRPAFKYSPIFHSADARLIAYTHSAQLFLSPLFFHWNDNFPTFHLVSVKIIFQNICYFSVLHFSFYLTYYITTKHNICVCFKVCSSNLHSFAHLVKVVELKNIVHEVDVAAISYNFFHNFKLRFKIVFKFHYQTLLFHNFYGRDHLWLMLMVQHFDILSYFTYTIHIYNSSFKSGSEQKYSISIFATPWSRPLSEYEAENDLKVFNARIQ